MPFYTKISIFYKKYGIFREKNDILKSNRAAIKKEKNINNAQTINFVEKYYVGVKWHFVSFLFFMKYTILCCLEEIWKKLIFHVFLHISKGTLLSQFLSYFFQNFYSDVNLHFEQVLFFMFIKNVDSLADIHGFSFFHGGHLGFLTFLKNFSLALYLIFFSMS